MYYVYILQSLKFKKIYIGFTKNLEKRFKLHNSSQVPATKPYIPYDLIYYSAFKNKIEAVACEKYLKTTSGWKRIHKILKDTLNSS